MNKHLSVIALSVTAKRKWIYLFWILLPVLSIVFIWAASYAAHPDDGAWLFMTEMGSCLGIAFFISFAGLFLTLAASCRRHRVYSQYTTGRLRISEGTVILWDGVVCGIALLVLWQIEIILIYLLNWYENGRQFGPGAMQMLKLIERSTQYYRVVFPIENVMQWPVNLAIIAACAFICAMCGQMGEDKYTGKRRKKVLQEAEDVRD